MATDQYLSIIIYICIWAVIASTAIWVTMTMTVLTMQSGSDHTKFVQKHLRKESVTCRRAAVSPTSRRI